MYNAGSNYPIVYIAGNITVLNNENGINIQKDCANNMFIPDNVDFYSDIHTTSNVTCINLNAASIYNKGEVDALIRAGGGGYVEVGLTDFYSVEDYDPYSHTVQRFAGSESFTQNRHMNLFDKTMTYLLLGLI